MSTLQKVLKRKFKTPRNVLRALGLDENVLAQTRGELLAMDFLKGDLDMMRHRSPGDTRRIRAFDDGGLEDLAEVLSELDPEELRDLTDEAEDRRRRREGEDRYREGEDRRRRTARDLDPSQLTSSTNIQEYPERNAGKWDDAEDRRRRAEDARRQRAVDNRARRYASDSNVHVAAPDREFLKRYPGAARIEIV